jgi:CRISPR-associated protein Csm1
MSEQILLQGKILGIEEFLLCQSAPNGGPASNGEELFAGRSQWVTLLCEVLPRALLAELKLARILLGSSGGGQFLLILPGEARADAEAFLAAANAEIERLSFGRLKVIWGATENLGDWSVVRKRLNHELRRKRSTPLAQTPEPDFSPAEPESCGGSGEYFSVDLGLKAREASTIGWSPEHPGMPLPGAGKHSWNLTSNLSLEAVTLARHSARSDDGRRAAPVSALARRAEGRRTWGVLRGDVDNFGIRLRRLTTIEEHVQLSVLYKQFFAGELEVLCSMPEFWRKVSILYSGGDDFAVYGSWDALISLARELQRLFHRFTQESLKDFPGPEGKTISMAIALAPAPGASLASVFDQAGRNLQVAKASDKNCIYLFGRVLEWKQLNDAAELKDVLTRTLADLRLSRQFLFGLRTFYSRAAARGGVGALPQLERAWRFHAQLGRMLGGSRDRDAQKLRAQLVAEIVGKNAAQPKLRPAGLVGLEWARLSTEV